MKRSSINFAGAVALGLLPMAGCMAPPPAAIGPTLAAQRDASERLGVACAQDQSLLRAQVEAHIEIRRVALLGELHRELISHGYLSSALEPRPDALDRDLADASATTALTRDVRAGAMTRDQASAWLGDYALALKMSEGDGVRAELLGRLGPVRELDAGSDALLAGLDARGDDLRALFADLDASGMALERYTMFRPTPGAAGNSAAREALGRLVVDRLTDPRKQEAARVALDLLFPAPAPGTNPVR